MFEDQSEESFFEIEKRFCNIRLTLLRYGGVGMSYSPKLGLKREMYLRGHIDNYDQDDRFEGKPILIRLETPPDLELEEKIKTKEQVDSACGWFSVRTNVEPTEVEQEFGEPPIEAIITISPDAFEAVSVHATETLDRIHRAEAKIKLVGKSLPETGTGPIGDAIRLTDLDVSEDKAYAIGEFDIGCTGTYYPRNRVLPMEPRLYETARARLSILLTDAAYQLDVPTGRLYSVWCHGSVINAKGKSYEGARTTVRFEEFHMHSFLGPSLGWDLTQKFQERALFGKFSYWPEDLEKEYPSNSAFDVDLKFDPQVRDDTRGLIIPILGQVAGAQVILTVDLTNEEEELLVATDGLEGGVRDYSFKVRSRLTTGSPDA